MILFRKKIKEKRKKNKDKKKLLSTQQTLPYIAIFDDGIMEVRKGYYSKSVKFEDVNYQIARTELQENFFLDYCSFLNSLDANMDYQISIMNSSVSQEELKEDILIKNKNDNLNIYREEYNNMLLEQIKNGRNDIKKEKYITFGCYANNKDEAKRALNRIEQDINQHFKKLNSTTEVVETNNRIMKLSKFYRGNIVLDEKMSGYDLRMGVTSKDIMAPDSFEFKRDYMMIGDQFARALFLSDIGSFMSDRILSDLSEFPFNMVLTLNIKPIEPHKAMRLINKQITGMEMNKIEYQQRSIKNGYFDAFIPHELTNRLEEALELRKAVTSNNQKLFITNVIIVHKAMSLEQLNIETELISAKARKHMCNLRKLNYQQEDGLASCLPFGNNRLGLTLQRTLTTESTAAFMPFTNQELVEKDGMYYGLNTLSGNMIRMNRKNLKNGNGFILGSSGSGKSFSAKREMSNILLNTDDEVLIIDPEREYTKLVESFGGQVIKVSAGSRHFINPLDMSEEYADDEDPLILKSDFILSLCEVIIGGRSGLYPSQKSIIDRCLKKVYQEYINNGFDVEKVPTLKDFYNEINEEGIQGDMEAKDIATALELYALGSQGVFANKTNVNTNHRLICYDIKDLGKQLKTMGMLIVLDAIWNRITTNRDKGKRTWIYMDEIYLLFNNDYSAQFLYELFKRARKWGAIPTGLTQNVEDLLKSETARSMLSNSEFIMLLNQAGPDRIQLQNLLSLSEEQLNFIKNVNQGQGLLIASSSFIPFTDKFPKNTKLYEMMTTKVEDIDTKGGNIVEKETITSS